MHLASLAHIKNALHTLNPNGIRELSERPPRVALFSSSEEGYRRMEDFLLRGLSQARRQESSGVLLHGEQATQYDLAIYDQSVASPPRAIIFEQDRPSHIVSRVLDRRGELGVPLAKSFVPFRRPFVERIVAKTCRENTLFSVSTAIPDVIPSVIELPWAVAEFASDTAFLTMNQVRMAFLIAAASDREIGYLEQKSEVATVIGSAFGWRAIARQLVGKIPFGGGLIAKAAVAYAGTKVLGLTLDHFYSIGFTYTREERNQIYADAFRHGKRVALRMLGQLRPDLAARYASQQAVIGSSHE
ncbi:MAG: hypothetical protein ACRD6B_08295 [Bryobacteraceae bacterium]